MNDLIRARVTRAKERSHKPLDRKTLRQIARKVQVLDEVDKLGDEFLELKYAHVEDHLTRCANIIRGFRDQYHGLMSANVRQLEDRFAQIHRNGRYLEDEYCKVAFHSIGYLNKELSLSARRIAKMQYAVCAQLLEYSQGSIDQLHRELNQEHLEARDSARANIDRLLDYGDVVNQQYTKLQAQSAAVKAGLDTIKTLMFPLLKKEPRFKDFIEANGSLAEQFTLAAHHYRWRWRARKKFENPLHKATLLDITDISDDFKMPWDTNIPSKVISTIMFNDKRDRVNKAIMEKRYVLIADRLRWPYLKKWRGQKPSWSTELDKYWRQLDVMAPFELYRLHLARMQKEIWYLVPTLVGNFGPMWDHLDAHSREMHIDRLMDWSRTYRNQQKEFLSELVSYRYINWVRLEVEEKLSKLGMPNEIQARGLFVPSRPLSQDHARFRRWIHMMSFLNYRIWTTNTTIRILKETGGPKTWLDLTKRFLELDAQRKSQVQDLGWVEASPRRAKRRKGRSSRLTKAKLKETKYGQAVHSTTTMNSSTKPPTDPTSSLSQEPSTGLPSKPQKVPMKEAGKRQASVTANGPYTRTLSWKRRLARSRLGPTAAWDYLGKAKDTPAPPAPVDVKTRFLQAMSMQSKPRPDETSDKPKTAKSTTIPSSSPRPSRSSSWQSSSFGAKWQSRESETPMHDVSAKKTPFSAETPLKNNKRNFWEPNPIPKSHGPFPKPKGRPYSTDSTVSHNDIQDSNRIALPQESPCLSVRPGADQTGKFPLSAEGASHHEIEPTSNEEAPLFWSHNDQRGPSGQRLIVHYCKSLESTEAVAKHFLGSKVIGFDMEWKAQAFATDSIQNNLSLIQIANEERIALFQIALFKPARSLEDLVAPSLKQIIESPDITKVGVSIKADSTRLRKYLGIDARSIFELSHLYKLIKYGQRQPRLVNKRGVNLSEQIEEHFGLPLEKSEDVRCGDWTRSLNYRQVQYAATDPYACICLYNVMEQKRQAMSPVPPRPAYAELNLPIICPADETVIIEDQEVVTGIVDGDVVDRS
ncbi:uncharacterized protein N7482_005454 [Penicillium canariense]|uniref:3'-5' exonuclease domain-containing protein n=1 Tax=Penicillium canariense TaxID=189055 RepID=A0A9W9LNG5_9EURO|nr:uncharacterized protein N7482_005454 [Penicillium canariense]KAJ5166673.1 hypothetical protein N7482_005454 [Penicillium canariense]